MAQRSTLNIHKNLDDLGPKMALPPLRMELTNFGGPIKFQNFRIFGGEKNEMYHKIEKVQFFGGEKVIIYSGDKNHPPQTGNHKFQKYYLCVARFCQLNCTVLQGYMYLAHKQAPPPRSLQ